MNALGLLWLRAAVTNVFSGALAPLELLPEPLRAAAWALPFRGAVHTPLAVAMGLHDSPWPALLHQAAWAAALWAVTVYELVRAPQPVR